MKKETVIDNLIRQAAGYRPATPPPVNTIPRGNGGNGTAATSLNRPPLRIDDYIRARAKGWETI